MYHIAMDLLRRQHEEKEVIVPPNPTSIADNVDTSCHFRAMSDGTETEFHKMQQSEEELSIAVPDSGAQFVLTQDNEVQIVYPESMDASARYESFSGSAPGAAPKSVDSTLQKSAADGKRTILQFPALRKKPHYLEKLLSVSASFDSFLPQTSKSITDQSKSNEGRDEENEREENHEQVSHVTLVDARLKRLYQCFMEHAPFPRRWSRQKDINKEMEGLFLDDVRFPDEAHYVRLRA